MEFGFAPIVSVSCKGLTQNGGGQVTYINMNSTMASITEIVNEQQRLFNGALSKHNYTVSSVYGNVII